MTKPYPLEPALVAFKHTLQKGALVLLPALGAATATAQILRFQYNPETMTRTRTGAWEARKTSKDTKSSSAAQDRAMEAFKGGGLFAKSETIAIKLIFDATEMTIDPDLQGGPRTNLGVLPELALLERMGIGEAPKPEENKKKDDTKLTAVVPKSLLLVLGPRTFPVIVTNMTITEKRFDPTLTPIRAEVDLQMQITEASEIQGQPALLSAYDQLLSNRTSWAAKGHTSDKPIENFIQAAMSGSGGKA